MNVDKLESTRKPPPRGVRKPTPPPVAEGLEEILNVNLEYAEVMDARVRAVVDELRMRGSVLILDPDKLEAQEEEASAELYEVMMEVAKAKTCEAEAEREMKVAEDEVYLDLLAESSGEKKVAVTDLRKAANVHPRVGEAHTRYLQACEARRQAEAYSAAIAQKLTLICGLQGARNRTMT